VNPEPPIYTKTRICDEEGTNGLLDQFVDFYYKTFDENRPALKALYV
jgi:hypothetical protein